MAIYWQLSFGKRPADELYDWRLDPVQLHNVADRAEYADTLKRLKEKLFPELERYEDPRIVGGRRRLRQPARQGRLLVSPEALERHGPRSFKSTLLYDAYIHSSTHSPLPIHW